VNALDREMKLLRRTWRRGGLPGIGTTPAVLPPIAEPARDKDGAEMERLVRPSDLPDDVRTCRPEVAR
jgi:hypothetical protein